MAMKTKYIILAFCTLLSACAQRHWKIVAVGNQPFRPNTVFQSCEDLTSPKFGHLIEKYRLEAVVSGETDEFKRILLLRHWIKSTIKIEDHAASYPGEGDVEAILDYARKGQGYHCGHFMRVQNAVMNAFGYVTRTLGAGPGIQGGPDGHHGINEIWLNQYQKWFLSDAKYDHHFEKNGIPLSALEIREEFLKNRAADIVKVKGPDRIPFDVDPETGHSKEKNAQTYTWIEWHGYNDMFTAWPHHRELLILYEDDYSRNHTWIWGGKPHWAYAQPQYRKWVPDRNEIYWTPNTIASQTTIDGKVLHVRLQSATPNRKEYQRKDFSTGEWIRVEEQFTLPLKKEKQELSLRAINLAGVAGPIHRILVESR